MRSTATRSGGQPLHDPWMMTKVLVYAYCVGVFRNLRRTERRLVEDIAFRVLAAGNQPNFRTISDFRKIHLTIPEGLFEQVLHIALEAGAMDRWGAWHWTGRRSKPTPAKHKAMSYDRMAEKQKQLKAEVKLLLKQAEAADAEEDAHYGRDRTGDELPAELERRETRLKKIREAKSSLGGKSTTEGGGRGNGNRKQAKPKEKDQYNFTDPESRIMKGADGFLGLQCAGSRRRPDLQLIVGQTVTEAPNDKEQLLPMVEVIERQSGQRPEEILADSGYCSEKNLEVWNRQASRNNASKVTLPRSGRRHDEYREACPKGRCRRERRGLTA